MMNAASSSEESSSSTTSGPITVANIEGKTGAGYGLVYDIEEILAVKKRVRKELKLEDWGIKNYAQLSREALSPPTDTMVRIRAEDYEVERFIEEFEAAGLCCIILGAEKDWPAMENWSLENLLLEYGPLPWDVGSSNHTYLSFAKFHQYTLVNRDDCPLYIFEPRYDLHYPQLLNDYKVSHLFPQDLLSYMGEKPRPYYRWILMGGARTGGGMHRDPHATCAWNTVTCGSKRWCLFPPSTRKSDIFDEDVDDNSVTWFNEVYPRLSAKVRATMIECIQKTGETMYLAPGWWHCVMNLEWTVCVTANYVADSNFEAAFAELNRKNYKKAAIWYKNLPPEYRARVRLVEPNSDDDSSSSS